MPLNINGIVINGTIAKVSSFKNVITRGLTYYLEASAAESIPETGTTWTDISSNNVATLTNGAVWSSTDNGIVTVDGTNDFIDCGNVVGSATTFTICSWLYPGSSQNIFANIFDNNHTGTQNWTCQQNSSNINQYDFGVNNTDTNLNRSTGLFNLTANTWSFLTFTFDTSGTIRGYVNASLFSTSASGGSITYSSPYLRLGAWGGQGIARYWNGRYGNFYYYNRALVAAEITQNFNVQRGRFGI
jgi:hypothetical protein